MQRWRSCTWSSFTVYKAAWMLEKAWVVGRMLFVEPNPAY
jgi:hypothetical protein